MFLFVLPTYGNLCHSTAKRDNETFGCASLSAVGRKSALARLPDA